MLRLSPELLIAAASPLVRINVSVGHELVDARPPGAEAESGECGDVPSPSDVRFIQHCGYWAHYDALTRTSSWPIPHALTVEDLATFGLAHDILYPTPMPGDLFLQYAPQRKAYVHAGIVVLVLDSGQFSPRAPYFDVYTMEADTEETTSIERAMLMRVRRRLLPGTGDRFLRWTDLDAPAGRGEGDFAGLLTTRWSA